jgi:hypothetical protein
MSTTILFENEDWMPPLRGALDKTGLDYEERFMDGGILNLGLEPEEQIVINRMSPSSHTRGHQAGVQFVREYLTFLEEKGVRIINGSRSFRLEVSKVQQDAALQSAGIRTPHTIAVTGTEKLIEASKQMKTPFITKHNQGGKGLGVQLFKSHKAFEDFINAGKYEDSPDSINLLQEYIEPAEKFITRVEIVDGKFLYAIRSSTEDGFELCPADACSVGDAFCPAPDSSATKAAKFQPRHEITADDPLVVAYIEFCKNHDIDVAGIEFVEDKEGNRYTYDINSTSNYNATVEDEVGIYGMEAIAELVAKELQKTGTPALHSNAA